MMDLFSKQSDYYAKYRPSYPKSLVDYIVGFIDHKSSVWDCATGTGALAFELADYFTHVYATDISDSQLKYAKQKKNIYYSTSLAEKTSFSSESFDLITVAQAIHWFNFDEFYSEAKRVLKPNGWIVVLGYGKIEVNDQIDKLVHAFYDEMFSLRLSENRKYLDEHYRNIPFPFYEVETPVFSSEYFWSLDDFHGYLYSWSAVQKYMEEEDANPTIPLIAKLSSLWVDKLQISFPIFLRIGRK